MDINRPAFTMKVSLKLFQLRSVPHNAVGNHTSTATAVDCTARTDQRLGDGIVAGSKPSTRYSGFSEMQRHMMMLRTNHLPRDAWSKRVLAYWLERVPESVARSQTAYERAALACRMQENGISMKHIGEHFDISDSRIREILARRERRRKWQSPVEKFLATPDFLDLKTIANVWAGHTGPRINTKHCAHALSCTLESFSHAGNLPKSFPP